MSDPLVSSAQDGCELMREFVPSSPFSSGVGIELDHIEDGRATLRLPDDVARTTYADIVHGGAITGLADAAVMATAWAGAQVPDPLRGVTISLSIEFVDAGRAEDLVAEGRVIRRGRSLTSVEVDIRGADRRAVANAIGTYKVG